MYRSLTQGLPAEFDSLKEGGSMLGWVWGGFSGAVIGVGISLSIGLFYSDAALLIVSVVGISFLLGALFGHMLAGMLADDVTLTARAVNTIQINVPQEQVIDLSDYRKLKEDMERKSIINHGIISNSSSIGSVRMALPGCLPDVRLFEHIVEQVHGH